jgi:hypothetical protein
MDAIRRSRSIADAVSGPPTIRVSAAAGCHWSGPEPSPRGEQRRNDPKPDAAPEGPSVRHPVIEGMPITGASNVLPLRGLRGCDVPAVRALRRRRFASDRAFRLLGL